MVCPLAAGRGWRASERPWEFWAGQQLSCSAVWWAVGAVMYKAVGSATRALSAMGAMSAITIAWPNSIMTMLAVLLLELLTILLLIFLSMLGIVMAILMAAFLLEMLTARGLTVTMLASRQMLVLAQLPLRSTTP